MAMQVDQVILGCDVSQDWLDIGVYGEDEPTHIDNEREAIDAYLQRHPAGVLGIEATNTFHELLVERALTLGLTVYVTAADNTLYGLLDAIEETYKV